VPGPTPEQLAAPGTEAAHQTALFAWCALPEVQRDYPELKLLFHIPNGGTRNKVEAGKLKAQGVKSGVLDLFLPVPRSMFAGLFIELKVGSNKLSENQQKWITELRLQHYDVGIHYGWIEASQHLRDYLALKG
jgi:hypothetical protein